MKQQKGSPFDVEMESIELAISKLSCALGNLRRKVGVETTCWKATYARNDKLETENYELKQLLKSKETEDDHRTK